MRVPDHPRADEHAPDPSGLPQEGIVRGDKDRAERLQGEVYSNAFEKSSGNLAQNQRKPDRQSRHPADLENQYQVRGIRDAGRGVRDQPQPGQ